MGFRKTKTSNSCSAIFWDDQLISVKSPAMHEACPTDPTEGEGFLQQQLLGFKRTQFIIR